MNPLSPHQVLNWLYSCSLALLGLKNVCIISRGVRSEVKESDLAIVVPGPCKTFGLAFRGFSYCFKVWSA